MKKTMIRLLLLLTVIAALFGYPASAGAQSGEAGWLSGWANRVPLSIDQSRIDATLKDFPVLVSLGKSSGMNEKDLSQIIDQLGDNPLKIALTTSDGVTQCYTEIDKWDTQSKQAYLWVKLPSVSPSGDNTFYLYYDPNQADNSAYVGTAGSEAARNVWDDSFKTVLHMGEDASSASDNYKDSTSSAHHATAGGSSAVPSPSEGKIGDSQSFAGGDYLQIPDHNDFSVSTTGELTISFWLSPNVQNMAGSDYVHYLGKGSSGSYEWAFRIYNASYRDRPQSLSIYHWNPGGDLGAGSRWDHSNIPNGSWVYVTGRFGRIDGCSDISIFGNGKRADTDTYSGYSIKPKNGNAPLKLGTRSNDSYLNGRLDEFRVSSVARSDAWIKASFYSEGNQLVTCGNIESSGSTINPPPTATPPVVIPIETPTPDTGDSIFGLGSGSSTYDQFGSALQAMRFQNTCGSGTLTKLELLVNDSTPSGKVRMGVYADNNGRPGTLLMDAGEATVANGWVSIDNLKLPVVNGQYYWLTYNLQSTNGIAYHGSYSSGCHYRVNGCSYGPLPATFPGGAQVNSNAYTLCATVQPD
jgi:hypothetical protein